MTAGNRGYVKHAAGKLRAARVAFQPVTAESQGVVRLQFPGVEPMDLQLLDVCIDGCQTRGPLNMCGRVGIYHRGDMTLECEGYAIPVTGEILRMEQDPEGVPAGQTALVTFRLGAAPDTDDDPFKEMLDELADQWQARQGG